MKLIACRRYQQDVGFILLKYTTPKTVIRSQLFSKSAVVRSKRSVPKYDLTFPQGMPRFTSSPPSRSDSRIRIFNPTTRRYPGDRIQGKSARPELKEVKSLTALTAVITGGSSGNANRTNQPKCVGTTDYLRKEFAGKPSPISYIYK